MGDFGGPGAERLPAIGTIISVLGATSCPVDWETLPSSRVASQELLCARLHEGVVGAAEHRFGFLHGIDLASAGFFPDIEVPWVPWLTGT